MKGSTVFLILFFLLLKGNYFLIGQNGYEKECKEIAEHIMLNGQSYNDLKILCKEIGHRLSGSKQADLAVKWGYETMKKIGLDSVWLQPVMVPVWVRGKEELLIQWAEHQSFEKVPVLSCGNSEGTNGKEVMGEIICFNSFDEVEKVDKKLLINKIVFMNYHFNQKYYNTFDGYRDAVKYRGNSPTVLSGFGVKAIIIRSVSTGQDDFPHTGATRYKEGNDKIPILAIGNASADRLANACISSKVQVKIKSECKMVGEKLSYNVIGELHGTHLKDKILLVGGHLDSWDVGEGAHDDGAGCVQSFEVLRTFKELGIKPQHTIRAVLFMNEENGLKGGLAYADSAKKSSSMHVLALESDAGGFSPRGISFLGKKDYSTKLQWTKDIMHQYGVYDLSGEGGGADVTPLFDLGCTVGELFPDSQRYFDVHHSANDVFEQVNPRELKLGAVALTLMIYLADRQLIFD